MMTSRIPTSRSLTDALSEQGLVPPNCTNVEIRVGVNSLMVLQYEVIITDDDLPKLAAAFKKAAEKALA